jgi:hypothetical protein
MSCPTLESLSDQLKELTEKVDFLTRHYHVPEQTYSTKEFAKLIGRNQRWVSDRVRWGYIKSITKKRPYQIPGSELTRFERVKI